MVGTRLLDRYELRDELGRGGMGVVYRTHDRLLDREVAVKLLSPDALSTEAEVRFEREARLVAQMDHPAIVPIYDFGRHRGALFYVMPILEGETLQRLSRERRLSSAEILEVVAQVAEALDYSHRRGVIHRDVKPENVMVARPETGGPRVRVMDFGLAVDGAAERVTRAGHLPGTLAYLSPEQIVGEKVDGRSDLYSLATVLYECLAGHTPFGGSRYALLYAIAHKEPPPLEGVDPELATIVLGTLAKDPRSRPQRGLELAAALRSSTSGLAGGSSPGTPWSPPAGPASPAVVPFVGRAAELAELRRRLAAAEDGECQLAIVAGEAGVGKTRLVEELAAEARERGVRVLHGRFSDQETALRYQGFGEVIQDYFRTAEPERETSSKKLSEIAAELLPVFPALGEIEELQCSAGLAASAGSAPPLVAEALRRGDRSHFLELMARTLAFLAGGRTLVLVLENLHEAEPSLEVLQYVLRRLRPTPLLIVGTCRWRPGSRRQPLRSLLRSFEGDPRLVSIVLEPLSRGQHKRLVEVLLGTRCRASDELIERLFEATEGNPFFTCELVRSLLESGGITTDSAGVWDLSGERILDADALPETIQQAVESRVERLPEDLRRLLELASVLGRRFELGDLEALSGVPREPNAATAIDVAAEILVREGILEEARGSRGDLLAFSSGVVRDVIYAGLPRRRRRALHRRCGRQLEKRWAGRLERVYPQLVHHFSEGDAARETVRYALELARLSLEATSPEDAVRAVRLALEFIDAEELSEPDAIEGELRRRLAQAERLAGRVEVAVREAGRAASAFERAGELPQAASAARIAAETAWQGRLIEEARRWVERGLELARAAGSTGILIELLKLGATVANLRGDTWAARAFLEEAERLEPPGKATGELLPTGGTVTTALPNPVVHLRAESFETVEEAEVLANVFEPLLHFDAEGRLEPLLCESWQVLDGGRGFRFCLRPGICFSDGTRLDPTAVKRSFERAAKKGGAARAAAFASIVGTEDFLDGRADEISGIELCGEREICFRLVEPLPIFPSLLSDLATSITGHDGLLGTGPFRLGSHDGDRIVLERNDRYWRGEPALVDRLVFRTDLGARAIAAALRAGELDLGRDLHPDDLDELLRDSNLRTGFVEATRRNVYFAAFNASGPACREPAIRRVLASAVRAEDLVWPTLGRAAQPAGSLIPPGVLGHAPLPSHPAMTRDEARAELAAVGIETPLEVRAVIHPLLLDRYGAFTSALLEAWGEVGVEVRYDDLSMEEFLAAARDFAGTDIWLSRWVPNYDDPDIFTYRLLHSRHGYLSGYLRSAEGDELLERARQEERPAVRRSLYRRFEMLIAEEAVLLPLFHEVDYRIAGPRLLGLELLGSPPFVNYARLGKVKKTSRVARGGRETLHVPLGVDLQSLDPAFSFRIETAEVAGNVFETLTRLEEGLEVVPWLASEFHAEDGARRYRFRLRPNVRFHDGRRLRSADVRHSLERLLHTPLVGLEAALLPVRGAQRLRSGEASSLEGFREVSSEEFVFDLERPMPSFPAMLSSPTAVIVAEGCGECRGNWRHGCSGTGPFRLVRFEPGAEVELEANPHYWRPDLPRSPRLVFELDRGSEEIAADFRSGRLALASHLLPRDFELLRRDPSFAARYRELPRFSTYFLGLNSHEGPLADAELRRSLVSVLSADALVRSSLGRLVVPARGLIPPGLLGHESEPRRSRASAESAAPWPSAAPSVAELEGLELRIAVLPVYLWQFVPFWDALRSRLAELDIGVRVVARTPEETVAAIHRGEVDLLIARWIAAYPDTDTCAAIFHSRHGHLGTFFRHREIDRIFEQGRAESEPALRHALYLEFERLIENEALAVPLFYEQTYRFARPELEGLKLRIGWPEVVYEDLCLVP